MVCVREDVIDPELVSLVVLFRVPHHFRRRIDCRNRGSLSCEPSGEVTAAASQVGDYLALRIPD